MAQSCERISMCPHIPFLNHHSARLIQSLLGSTAAPPVAAQPPKPGDLARYLKLSWVGGGAQMKEGQREELCSDEARRPRSASATRAGQIVESSRSTETKERPRMHQEETNDTKKYICISTEFDQIGAKNILDTWCKLGLLSLLDYYKFSHKCTARGWLVPPGNDIVCKCGSCVMVSFLRYYLALAAISTFRAVGLVLNFFPVQSYISKLALEVILHSWNHLPDGR